MTTPFCRLCGRPMLEPAMEGAKVCRRCFDALMAGEEPLATQYRRAEARVARCGMHAVMFFSRLVFGEPKA